MTFGRCYELSADRHDGARAMSQEPSGGSVDPGEAAKFAALADEWWDPDGKFAPLHRFNPLRLQYIRDHLCHHFGRDDRALRPLDGLRLLDIGCGGGLLSEPMARLGGDIVGVDVSSTNVATAATHARDQGLAIDYRCTTAEALRQAGERFDVVLNMEVVEHVADVDLFIGACAAIVKPGGLMITATLNRTLKAFALAIVGAEYVLGWLPRGTHEWRRFVTPDELGTALEAGGLVIIDRAGASYNPLADGWSLTRELDVNYMIVAARPK